MRKLTTAEFIERARKVHGDRYDYSQANYVNSATPLTIICPVHGSFNQTSGNHFKGKGCPQCALLHRAKSRTKSTEQWIAEAREIHGDYYDYSKAQYTGQNNEVTIDCPKHGEFKQKPKVHLMGSGCPQCGVVKISEKKRANTDSFINNARAMHGEKYDYSETEYITSTDNVRIICPKHGVFEQIPSNHLRGKGCPACGNVERYGTDGFIDRARNAHGDKYDYSKTEYVNAYTKVEIICPLHGVFMQKATHHVSGIGCPGCKLDKLRAVHLKTEQDFIEESIALHGDQYDYSKVVYKGSKTPVLIGCPVHGDFEQQPRAHLQCSGCPLCGDTVGADKRRSTTDDFIKAAIDIHGHKYDYSKVDYRGAFDYVTIVCSEHGEFRQAPTSHLSGTGCPICAEYGFQHDKPGILYYLRISSPVRTVYKIGITNRSIEKRFSIRDRPAITILKTWDYQIGRDAYEKEQAILKEYAQYRYEGIDRPLETGNTELFTRDVLGLDKDYS